LPTEAFVRIPVRFCSAMLAFYPLPDAAGLAAGFVSTGTF
jgi:hypothetical protein